jgi:pimeloyl-ACP methyl ester carboxylesterase
MYYEEYGSGQPLVLLHRGLATGRIWQPHISLFAERYRVIAPDSRGHGYTANPAGTISYRMMADDIAALIKTLGLSKPLVCGYSDGGNTALELGLRHPELTCALVIGGAAHKLAQAPTRWLKELGVDGPGTVDFERIRRTWPAYAEKWQARHSPQGADHWKSLLLELSVMWCTPLNYTPDDFAGIKVPALILTGDRDETVPLEETVEMYRLIPGSELAVLPGLDHLAAVDRADQFVPVVTGFFQRRLAPSQPSD